MDGDQRFRLGHHHRWGIGSRQWLGGVQRRHQQHDGRSSRRHHHRHAIVHGGSKRSRRRSHAQPDHRRPCNRGRQRHRDGDRKPGRRVDGDEHGGVAAHHIRSQRDRPGIGDVDGRREPRYRGAIGFPHRRIAAVPGATGRQHGSRYAAALRHERRLPEHEDGDRRRRHEAGDRAGPDAGRVHPRGHGDTGWQGSVGGQQLRQHDCRGERDKRNSGGHDPDYR